MIDQFTLKRMRQERAEALAHSEVAPTLFLDAWKKGVNIVGKEFFESKQPLMESNTEPADILSQVTDKWQLTPRWEFIEQRIGVLSGGEAALLAVMCSFYNSEWGGKLMRDIGIEGMADINAKLDPKETKIIADLLINYSGW